MTAVKDLTGQTFNRLTVISRASNYKCGSARWNCICSCGVSCVAGARSLLSGKQQACGCLRLERARAASRKHGASHTREFYVWQGMKARCTYPKNISYQNYGGRGIRVCDEWMNSYETFRNDMGPKPTPRHTLERVDNDGPYAPWNCKWATRVEQRSNRRDTRRAT